MRNIVSSWFWDWEDLVWGEWEVVFLCRKSFYIYIFFNWKIVILKSCVEFIIFLLSCRMVEVL